MKKYEKDALAYYAYVDYDGKRWVSNLRHNGLYTIDKETKEVEYIGEFKGNEANKMGLHSIGDKVGTKLFFFPQRSGTIDIYDAEKKIFESIIMEPWKKLTIKGCAGVVRNGEKFWMIPRHVGGDVLVFDINLLKFVDAFSLEETNKLVKQDELLTMQFATIEEKLWIPIYDTNKVVVVDLAKKSEKVFEIDNAILHGGIGDERFLWLSAKGEIIKYDTYKKIVCERYKLTNMNENEIKEVSYMVKGNETIFIIPRWEEEVVYIDTDKKIGHISLVSAGSERVEDIIKSWRLFGCAIWEEESLIIPPVSLNKEFVIGKGLNVTGYKLVIKEGNFQPRIFNMNGRNMEMRNLDLEEFIDGLNNIHQVKEKELCGKKILSECIYSSEKKDSLGLK